MNLKSRINGNSPGQPDLPLNEKDADRHGGKKRQLRKKLRRIRGSYVWQ